MSNKTEKETLQPQNLKTQPVQTIDPNPPKTSQNQLQNKEQTQAKTNIQQKANQSKVQQSNKGVEKKEQKHQQQHKTKEQIIRQYITSHKIQINNDQIIEFIKQEIGKAAPFQPNILHQWIQTHKKGKKPQEQSQPKTQIPNQKQIKNEEKKNSEDTIQLTNKQIINDFLQKETVEQIKQIQPDLVEKFNKQIVSRLEIKSQTILAFLKSESNKNYEGFKQWLTKHEQTLISQWHKKFQKSVIAKQIQTHLTKLKSIIDLADQNKSNLSINIGAGESKGKTSLKMGMLLKQSQESKFRISIEVKIKKKVQLKQFIQNQIKKLNKADDEGLYKFSKIKFEQTQKSLNIQLNSQVFENYVFKSFIDFLQKKFSAEKTPILKTQVQVNVKNSIKQDENLLQNKRFIKWLAQGFTKSIKIQGNKKLAQHFSSPLAQYFPIFKVVRSGDVLLKLKKIQNVDKLFDKLGINQICQQTPNLQKYLSVMVKQHLDSKIVLWVGDIIKHVLLFACNIPNQRISIETNIAISHLNLYLNISAQACKELGELVSKTMVEQLS